MPECSRNHGYPKPEPARSKQVADGEIEKIVDRLYNTQTESWACTAGSPLQAEDIISKKNATGEDVKNITERLASSYIRSMLVTNDDQARAVDILSRKPAAPEEVNTIVDRLHTTHTVSSSGEAKMDRPASSKIAKEPKPEEEIKEIFERLNKTHTVSSANTGQIRHPKDPPKPPGYGMKMFPIIEGLDTRFAGFPASQDKVAEVVGHLMKTQTTASQAKLDNPRILLYPERTTLMNNVERIRAYQENGAVAKQNMLQRREKWYN